MFSATAIMLLVAIFFAIATRVSTFSAEPERTELGKELNASELQQTEANLRELTRQINETETQLDRLRAIEKAENLSGSDRLATAEDVAAAEQRTADQLRAMQAEEANWTSLRQRIIEIENESDTLLLIPKASDTLREPVMLIISADWIDLEFAQRPDLRRRVAGPVNLDVVRRALREFSPKHQILWVGLRPSSAGLFDTIRTETLASGFKVSWEPIGETQKVNFHSSERAVLLLP